MCMMRKHNVLPTRRAFSLMEVVLAVGVISIAVVALLGLLAPTVSSVRHIVDKDSAIRIDGIVRSYIEDELLYSGDGSVSQALAGGDPDSFDDSMVLYIWEEQANALDGDAITTIIQDDLGGYNATGGDTIGVPYVVVLSPLIIGTGANGDYDYTNADNEGYIPFRVRMYQLDRSNVAAVAGSEDTYLTDSRLIFDYPSAKLQ